MTPQSTIKAMQQAAEILLSIQYLDKENCDDGIVGVTNTLNFLVQEIEKAEDPLSFTDMRKVQ